MSELDDLGVFTCGAVRFDGDSRSCVLTSDHTIHQDIQGERWTVKEGFVLEMPAQRRH